MLYHFTVFKYDAAQKTLSHSGTPVEIPKKCHELLLFLLNNPNRLVNRDELIDHVWHGRVVTNNTIDQCILKLRKALNQNHEGDYIESVYGQGIRFLPPITTGEEKTDNKPSQAIRIQWLILVVSMAFLLLWLSLKTPNDESILQAHTDPINIQPSDQTGSPKPEIDNAWLQAGGAGYIMHLLNQYRSLEPKRPVTVTNEATNSQALTVNLTGELKPELTLWLEVTNQNQQHESAYKAEIRLSNNEGVFASNTINATELTQLYPMATNWVAQQIGIETTDPMIDPQVFTQDEFALQSYFRAMSAQAIGDSGQALTYLKTAVEQDPTFKTAWYEMAISLRKQADPRKAIGILNAISSDDVHLSYKVNLVKAQCLDTLGAYEAAAQTYAQALLLAESSKNPSKIAAVYISQAILYRKTEQYELAKRALDQAELVTDANSQPQLYGTIMNTYAKLARNNNQPLLAIEKAELAIDAFQRSGDLRYQMQAKTVLASILRMRNEFNLAEQLVKESLFHAEQMENRRGISDNRTKLARIYQQTGRFRLALEQWQMVLTLNNELELHGNTAEAYLWLLQLHLQANNSNQAEIDLKMLTQLYNEYPADEIHQYLLEAQFLMALYQQDTQASQNHLTSLVAIDHPLSKMYQGDVALLQQKQTAAEMHYLEALLTANSSGYFDQMVLVLNRLNALYLNFNTEKLNENLLRTGRLKPFIYPYQKYLAQAAKADGENIKALSLMEELKLKAGDFWQYPDQLLLESMEEDLN